MCILQHLRDKLLYEEPYELEADRDNGLESLEEEIECSAVFKYFRFLSMESTPQSSILFYCVDTV